ncbi:MAG: hypothetical protein GXY76_08805 [Chloroflexi bacterium]|nr:hypothetical protein [Chloroflexota bacterium]
MQLPMVLVIAEQGLGVLHVRGSYTGVVYAIPPQGVLVHPYDVEGILAQQKTFCCRGGEEPRQIYPFHVGKATAGQVAYVEVPDPEPTRASTLAVAAVEEAAPTKGRRKPTTALPPEPDEVAIREGEPAEHGGDMPPGG